MRLALTLLAALGFVALAVGVLLGFLLGRR